MRLFITWKWFDVWIGAYWSRGSKTLYICPVPTVVIGLDFSGEL